jgi:hypothetical protein
LVVNSTSYRDVGDTFVLNDGAGAEYRLLFSFTGAKVFCMLSALRSHANITQMGSAVADTMNPYTSLYSSLQ